MLVLILFFYPLSFLLFEFLFGCIYKMLYERDRDDAFTPQCAFCHSALAEPSSIFLFYLAHYIAAANEEMNRKVVMF